MADDGETENQEENPASGSSRWSRFKEKARQGYKKGKEKISQSGQGDDSGDDSGEARGKGTMPINVTNIVERAKSGNFVGWIIVVALVYIAAYYWFLPFRVWIGIWGFKLLVGIIWVCFILYGLFSGFWNKGKENISITNFFVGLVLLVWLLDMIPADFPLFGSILGGPYAGFEFDWKSFSFGFSTTILAVITSGITFAFLYVNMIFDIIKKDVIMFGFGFGFIVLTNKLLANFIPSYLSGSFVLVWGFWIYFIVTAVLVVLAVWLAKRYDVKLGEKSGDFFTYLLMAFVFSFFWINNGWIHSTKALYHAIFILCFGFFYIQPHERKNPVAWHIIIPALLIIDFYGYGLLYSTDILFVQFIPVLVIFVLAYCYYQTKSKYALVSFIFLVTVILILSLVAVNAYQTGSIQFQARGDGKSFSTFLNTLTKQTTSLLEGQLETATGGLYRSQVEKNQYEPLGVYLTDIRASQPRYRSDEPVTIWGKISAKTLSDPIIINFNCYRFEGKDENKQKIPIKAEGLYPNKPFSVFTYEEKDTECNFNTEEDQVELKPGSNEVSLSATYNFDTSAYHKVYFIDKARQRSMLVEGLDPLKEFGITDKNPVTVYTNGPVELAVSISNIVTVSSEDDLAPVIGILLKNRDRISDKAGSPLGQWEGKIKDIKELVLVLPRGVSLKKVEKDQRYDCKPSPFKDYSSQDCKNSCQTYVTEPCHKICNENEQCIERDCKPSEKRCLEECDDLFRVDSAGGAELKGYQLDIESIKSEFKSDDLKDIDKFRTFGCRLELDGKEVLDNTPITTKFIRLKARYNYTVEKGFNINVDSIKIDETVNGGLVSDDGSGRFPVSNCQYNGQEFASKKSNIDKIINGLAAAGINTKNGISGVLGNFRQESNFDPTKQGKFGDLTCSNDRIGPQQGAIGIAQWCRERRTKLISKHPNSYLTIDSQVDYLVSELTGDYKGAVAKMNAAGSPEQAALIWQGKAFESATPSLAGPRDEYARQVYNGLECT
ncbi:MAG TPA: phage tail tip lysozyme [Candidatus Nanoarchaeia archaeon]|nr:phage tail tip lysozyme [Candidatus Nanoarchaeia archaeon]